MNLVIRQKWHTFTQNRRAYISAVVFLLVFVISLFSELIANDKPLLVKYKGAFYFPIFKTYTDEFFGGDFPTPADYRDVYTIEKIKADGWMIMPPIPYSYNTVDYESEKTFPSSPDERHLLGTDDEGRDIVARILYGIRLSVIFAFLLTLCSSVIGIVIGAIQGYFGGKTDIILQRVIEICGQRFFTDILDDIGNIDVIFMDITDINGQGRIFKDT